MGWIAALFVGLLGWLLVRDIRERETALVTIQAYRASRPVVYWAIIAFWSICLLLCLLLALGAYFQEAYCEGEETCVLVLQVAPQ